MRKLKYSVKRSILNQNMEEILTHLLVICHILRRVLRLTPSCECGSEREDADHFFFQCHKCENERIRLFRNTRRYHPLNLNTLLSGCDVLSFDENMEIFNIFVKKSGIRADLMISQVFPRFKCVFCIRFIWQYGIYLYMHTPLSRSFCRFLLVLFDCVLELPTWYRILNEANAVQLNVLFW